MNRTVLRASALVPALVLVLAAIHSEAQPAAPVTTVPEQPAPVAPGTPVAPHPADASPEPAASTLT